MDSADTEFTENVGPCGICGANHSSSDCDTAKVKCHIADNAVLSKARLSLPKQLQVIAMAAEASFSVVAAETIEQGTRFGPFDAKKLFTLDPNINFMLKVFNGDEYFEEYYLDNSNECDCNWMYFVQPATNLEEQNLICYEDKAKVYYLSIKQINAGEHLKVWYSSYYCLKMKKDQLSRVEVDDLIENHEKPERIPLKSKEEDQTVSKTWTCKFCNFQENSVVNFASHMKDHYVLQMRKVCEICKAVFKTQISLKKHLTMVHYDHFSEKSKTRSGEKMVLNGEGDNVPGDPVMNNALCETNVLLDHMIPTDFDMEPPDAMLDNENLNLGLDKILDDSENFNFQLEDSTNFTCDICFRSFARLKLLIVHLSRHTGVFKCNTCSTVFSRKENLVAHSCSNTLKLKCDDCDQTFMLRKYLRRHVAMKHSVKYKCEGHCKKVFTSDRTLQKHQCAPAAPETGVSVSCTVCRKEFASERNLRRHMKTHAGNAPPILTHLCDICSNAYKSSKQLQQHLASHHPKFCCEECGKKFIRRKNYVDHLEIHKKNPQFSCAICDQKFALKKYLDNHMVTHNDEYKYQCLQCPRKFKQKTNLQSHLGCMHRKKCPSCDEHFATVEELKQHRTQHTTDWHQCPVCNNVVKLRSSLVRHMKRKHGRDLSATEATMRTSAQEDTQKSDDIVQLLNFENTATPDSSSVQDIDTNLQYIVNDYDANQLIDNTFDAEKNRSCKALDDNVLDFNSLAMEFEKNIQANIALEPPAMSLSMPDLGDMDQNVSLGQNTFIALDSNGVMEPTFDQGNVVLYIYDDKKENQN